MQWYRGDVKTLIENWQFSDNPFWADYQVLGPSFGALSVFMSMTDVLPIMIGSRGCATHLRFTKIAWGGDFGLEPRPLPFIEVSQSQVIHGQYAISTPQLTTLQKLVSRFQPHRLVLVSNDDVLLTCADLTPLQTQLEKSLGIPTSVLEIAPISGANQWVGYDKALGLLYEPFMDDVVEKKEGINLVGWKWPSRERHHDIGACLTLLKAVGVPVNHVIPGGASLADIQDSLASQVNLLWCPSYIGETLERLEWEKGLRLAGFTPPYGFEGTMDWLSELGEAIGDPRGILQRAEAVRCNYGVELDSLKALLQGKRAFISGGPGRLIGLLHVMADLDVDVPAAALFWPHSTSQQNLSKVMQRLPKPPRTLLVSPSLYELEEIASEERLDFWMGGYQEHHTCKRHGIPFVPTTVYTASNQCFEGVIHLGRKIEKALNGFDFVANVFRSVEAPNDDSS
ncbi:MAG: hypothetical protein FJ026_02830 [Chloroflexi bacterium]|nr:hypothetical protein [Chloroflexota bacterium]